MKPKTIYILLYNNAVQFASKELKILAASICTLATAINQPLPHSYVQITRIMSENKYYIHSTQVGHTWSIIERELLYQRRRQRNAVQRATPQEIKEARPVPIGTA